MNTNGIKSARILPDEVGSDFTLKEISSPLKPYQDQLLLLNGLCDKIRGDGDGHIAEWLSADRHRAVSRQYSGRLGHASNT